jgi:hypothetical protein
MDYVIYNEEGFLNGDGEFGPRENAIEFDLFQALAISNATGWDYMGESDMLIDETEQEDKDVMDEIDDWSLSHDWDNEDELIDQMEAFLAADIEALS